MKVASSQSPDNRCFRLRRFAAIAIVSLCIAARILPAAEPFEVTRLDPAEPRFRRPVAAGLVGGNLLCVANQRSGSVSLVDISASKVVGEWHVGEELSDLIVLPKQNRALATDEKRHELVALDFTANEVRLRCRLPVSRYPISVRVDSNGKQATVAGLWSHRLDVIDLTGLANSTPTMRVLRSIEVPFPPRRQLLLSNSDRLLLADAFGGRLALIDWAAGKLIADRSIDGHNIRGLALSADEQSAIAVFQRLSPQPITPEAIEAGSLMKSLVGMIPLAEIAKAEGKLSVTPMQFTGAWNYENLSDPGGIAMFEPAELVVAFAGVDRVGVFDVAAAKGATIKPREQARVGHRPVAVVADAKKRLLVVNNLSDSISIIDPQVERSEWQELPLGPMPEAGPRDRGELMFDGAKEAFHWWASCHSCHTDGHTCGQLADTLGDNSHGAPKRVLSLLGTGLTDPWAWNGGERELRDQLHKSLETTSYNRFGYVKDPEAAARRLEDLAAFLHSLPPPPPLEPPTNEPGDAEQIERGRRSFHDRGCARCHVPPLTYTSPEAYDVGLVDEQGQKKFNPPSLRGVSQGESFLHDGRAKKLSDVFTEFGHGLAAILSNSELADLLRFLRSI